MTNRRTHIFSGSIYEDMAGYARAVLVGDAIYVSGTVGIDPETGALADGVVNQTHAAFDTIEATLVEAGSGLHDIVRVRVYAPDPADIAAISGVLKARVGFTRPTNTTVCTALAVPGARVELEVEVMRGSGTPRG